MTTTLHRAFARAALGAVAGTAVILATATTSAAHVTIRPDVDTTGSYTKLTVRVPNESDTAGTVSVQLDLPTDVPFPSVRVKPHAGWTTELTKTTFDEPVNAGDYVLTEAVTSITWTAEPGVRIGPDEFEEFAVSLGPLPAPGTYSFPAIQTYDDGEVVAWDAEPRKGTAEPDRPAPVLTVVEAAGADEDTGRSDSLARGVGLGGILVGAAGIGLGAVALRRRGGAHA